MSLSNLFTTIILLGALQGFIISGLLIFKKPKRLTNQLLSALLCIMALASLNIYLINQPWFQASTTWQIFHSVFPMVLVMPVGPLIYFYVRSSLDLDFTLRQRHKIHFYPVIIDLVPQIIAIIYIVCVLCGMNISGRPIGHFIDSYDTYSDIPRWLSISIYVWFSAKQLGIKNTTETKEQTRHTTWLHHFIRVFQVFQVIWLLYLIPYAIPATTNWVLDTLNWYPVYLPLAVLIYYLGLKGYLVTAQTIKTRNSILKENLDQSQINDLMGRLYKSMEEEKLYRDPNLNLVSLSQHVGFSSKTISALLNQEVQKNFNEFINSYRIGEIKERLLEKENQNITIVGLAYECGFNSQPTFQRAFKTIVGVSPKKFLAQTT